MEARVDVRKLQILNDRINQTIDALNQVRLSVHGLGHTAIQNPFLGQQGYGVQQGMGMQNNPYSSPGMNPFSNVGGGLGQLHTQLGQLGLGSVPGFQHSPFQQMTNPFVNPYTTNPWLGTQSLYGQQIPFTQPSPFTQQNPFLGTPWTGVGGVAGGIGGGLFHSSQDVIDRQIAEFRASDPQRITQTFPFVSY
jgi:hypothetical protein